VPEVGPYWLAAIRVAVGFLVLLPYVLFRGVVMPATPGAWTLLIGMALLNVVFPFLLISWASLSLDAGIVSLLMGTGPFFALAGSHLLTTDDRLTPHKLIGVLLGFSGILVIVGFDAVTVLWTQSLVAQLACFLASLCYVTAGLIIRRIDIPPGRLACLALGISSVVLIVLALVVDGLPASHVSATAAAALFYLGLLPTGLAYLLRFYLIRKIGYSTFSMGLNLIPVFGILLGVWLLGEPLTLRVLLALALVVCGLFVARSGSKPALANETGR